MSDITIHCTTLYVGAETIFNQPLTEKSTRHIKIIMFPGSKVRPVRRADNRTTICEPIVLTMWDP
jgi:hypothetical protein